MSVFERHEGIRFSLSNKAREGDVEAVDQLCTALGGELTTRSKTTHYRSLDLRNWPSHGPQISGISGLENLVQLEELDLSFNWIDDLEPLEALTKLRSLDIRNTHVTELAVLQHLPALRYLRLNPSQNAGALRYRTELEINYTRR